MKVETRKKEIIKTATMLFKEKGYSAVTMRDIAKALGIKAASLYNHINSKQHILRDIIMIRCFEYRKTKIDRCTTCKYHRKQYVRNGIIKQ